MFEDSLVESRVGHSSTGKRWTALVSTGLQCAIAATVIALPLLHPAALPLQASAPRVMAPLLPKPPVHVRVPETTASSASAAFASSNASRPLLAPIFQRPSMEGDAPAIAALPFGSGMGSALPDVAATGNGERSHITIVPARKSGPLHVSTGVSQGMLLSPIRPVYPAIARAAGVQGTVVVEAVISRDGTIESLHVVSGPVMLQAAALTAIREARYRPFLLNGAPTEVQTTFTVNFRMNG